MKYLALFPLWNKSILPNNTQIIKLLNLYGLKLTWFSIFMKTVLDFLLQLKKTINHKFFFFFLANKHTKHVDYT